MKRTALSYKAMYRYVCTNLDEEIDSPKCREIKKHLDSCPDCTIYLDTLKKTVELFRRYPDVKVPKKTHQKLYARIRFGR